MHRDLKPGNVPGLPLMPADGRVLTALTSLQVLIEDNKDVQGRCLLADFGLARCASCVGRITTKHTAREGALSKSRPCVHEQEEFRIAYAHAGRQASVHRHRHRHRHSCSHAQPLTHKVARTCMHTRHTHAPCLQVCSPATTSTIRQRHRSDCLVRLTLAARVACQATLSADSASPCSGTEPQSCCWARITTAWLWTYGRWAASLPSASCCDPSS